MKASSVTVIGLYLFLYILPLGVRPVCIPDEARYAEIPREMIASGDWVVPRLNGLRYFEKPPLGYWLNAGSMMLFGENAFAARFPSALAAGISGLLVFLLVRRFKGRYSTGMLSAVVMLTCMEVYGVATFSVLDTVFSMFVTSAMVSFFFAYMEDKPGIRTAFRVLLGACCGLAFLTKGFIAFAVPIVAIVPFMIWEGRLKELLKISWVPIGVAILLDLPWAIMIHFREPDFWRYFFWTEHIHRFISESAQHAKPFWFFLPVILVGALPWTALLPAVVSGLRMKRQKDSLMRFTVCWFLFPFLFFSASHGKLYTYILPCFPPLAILMAVGVLECLESDKKRIFSIGASYFAVLMAICAAALLVFQITGFSVKPYDSAETWKFILLAIGLVTWSILSALAGIAPEPRKKLVMFCTAPFLLMLCAHFIMPDKVRTKKMPGSFLMRNASRVHPDDILVTNTIVRAVCFFYRRNDVLLLRADGELRYGLDYDDSKNRLISVDNLRELIRDSGNNRVVLITKAEKYQHYKQQMPTPRFEDSNGRIVFVCY